MANAELRSNNAADDDDDDDDERKKIAIKSEIFGERNVDEQNKNERTPQTSIGYLLKIEIK